jgi:RHS repeat-associated protein
MNKVSTWIVALGIAWLSGPLNAQTVEYIHTDALGSIVAITDEHRNVIERREYEPYGAQLTPALRDGPGYTGHLQDAATGLVQMQQRYYDPDIGRFLSVDPVTAYSGDPRHFNRYVYGYNNPYRFNDPDGRCPVCIFAIPIVLGGGVGAGSNYLVQKGVNPGTPVSKVEVGVSGVAGALSGGTGAALVSAVARGGAVTVGRAVAAQAGANAVIGGSAASAQGAIEGTPVSGPQIAAAAVGNAAGGLAGSAAGVVAGDFAAASAKGTL